MVLIDAGVRFPEVEMHGVDLVIPDFSYVPDAPDDLRAIRVTHGHEGHIGPLPYLLMRLDRSEPVPIYGTRLTLGLIAAKLKEHRQGHRAELIEFEPGQPIDVEPFRALPVFVNHSVPGDRKSVV